MFTRRHFRIALLALAVASASQVPVRAAQAPEWSFDPAHSSISFSVRHILTQVTGTFDRFTGTLRFDPANLAGSHVEIEIPISSINTRNAQRDGHLQSADFFDAAQFPTMKFTGDTFVRRSEGKYAVHGLLTIRGVTRPVTLPFEYKGAIGHPMKPGHVVTGTRLEGVVQRSDFGVGSGSWAETAVIGDEVSITIDVEALRPHQAAPQPAAASRPAAGTRATTQPSR